MAAAGGGGGAPATATAAPTPTLAAWDTVLPADLVEVCPSDPALVACGTYLLESGASEGSSSGASQRKRGAIKLVAITPTAADGASGGDGVTITPLHSVDTAAVFDAKWLPAHERQLLVTVTSDGAGVQALELVGRRHADGGAPPELRLLHHTQLAPDVLDTSALSVALLPPLDAACVDPVVAPLAVSRSDGRITVTSYSTAAGFGAEYGSEAGLPPPRTWLAHTYDGATPAEVWTVAAVTPPMGGGGAGWLLWSGADDGLLKAWDARASSRAPAWTNRAHGAGVCAIEQHPAHAHLVATGSYDEVLRVWDQRNMAEPVAAVETGGGVWRIRWHPHAPDTAVAACMYAGAAVINLSPLPLESGAGAPWLPSTASVSFMQRSHTSIVYGAAWLPHLADGASATTGGPIATCSFYDHALHVWRPTALS